MATGGIKARLGPIGVWSMELRFCDPGERDAAAAEIEALGYGAIWIPGGIDDSVLAAIDGLLAATSRITIASGILNLWKHEPADVAAWYAGLHPDARSRVLIGIGISHGPIIGQDWGRPIATTRDYLDRLAAAGLDLGATCLAALGPKMLDLARERTAGAHPYLVTPEHTREARERLGPAALLAPEQGVVLETDPARARAAARDALGTYLSLPNYVNSWRRLGFSEDEIAGKSDRLVDALFAWGDAAAIRARIDAHLAAGADHVCIQVVDPDAAGSAARTLPALRELAATLL